MSNFRGPPQPDQADAAETLGKLGYYPSEDVRKHFQLAAEGNSFVAVEASWVLANSGEEGDERRLAAFLFNSNEEYRSYAAYALRFRPTLRLATRNLLISRAKSEPVASSARAYLFASAIVHAFPDERQSLLTEVESYIDNGTSDEKFECMNALALVGGRQEINRLDRFVNHVPLYNNENPDLQVGAANAIVNILLRLKGDS